MRARAGGRPDSSGTAWHRVGKRGPQGEGSSGGRRWRREWRPSGRNIATAALDGNVTVFFILRNGERIKIEGNMPIGLVARRPDGRTPAL